jgi:zinc/manganese transport system substrate-binding protein
MTRVLTIAALGLALLAEATPLHAAIKVVATIEDLAALTREVGGDKVKVEALARGYQDPHFVEAKPSFILKLHSADLLVLVGRELEIGWLPPLIQQSRNRKVQVGADGYLDASLTVRILEIPTGQITRAMGDVHPLGNPHYWLDPGNGRRVAAAIRDKLSAMSPADAAYFTARYDDFDRRLTEAETRWDALMAPYKGL